MLTEPFVEKGLLICVSHAFAVSELAALTRSGMSYRTVLEKFNHLFSLAFFTILIPNCIFFAIAIGFTETVMNLWQC